MKRQNWAEELNNAKELQQSVHQRFQALVAKENSEMAALLSDPLWSESVSYTHLTLPTKRIV